MSSGKKPGKGAPVETSRWTRIVEVSERKPADLNNRNLQANEHSHRKIIWQALGAVLHEMSCYKLDGNWTFTTYCKQFWTEIFEVQQWVTFSLFSSTICQPEVICVDLIQCRSKWSITNVLTKANNIVSGMCSFFLDNKSFTERLKSRLNDVNSTL